MNEKRLKSLKIGTRAIAAIAHYDHRHVRAHIPPIFQTVNYEYADAEEAFAVFRKEKPGYIYSRGSNPTTDLLGRVVALLEEGESYVVAASGMAAISAVFLTLLKPGDHIVSSSAIYGGTRNFFKNRLTPLKINTSFIDITDPPKVRRSIKKNSKILYTEVLGNPNLMIADIAELAEIAREYSLSLVVDNTFSPPPLVQPLKLGADIVIHSATKYLGGHGDLIGGVAVCSEEQAKNINKTLEIYGGTLSPFNAWLALRGIKTLGVRLERQCENAATIAQFLSEHKKVNKIFYPGLPDHPQHALARQQLNAYGAMLAFEIKGGFPAGKKLLNSVSLCNFTVSLGEIDTLIMHPASTSHVWLSKEEREAIGISDGLIRLSVGIEDIVDLIGDLENALTQI